MIHWLWLLLAFFVGMIAGEGLAQWVIARWVIARWVIARFRKRSDARARNAERSEEAQQTGVFHATTGAIGPQNVWGKEHAKIMGQSSPLEIPHEEQAPMFLDQFLLRYFYDLVQPIDFTAPGRPWELFVQKNPWAKEMPVLFHQLTSIQLTDMQLNGAIADYMSRLSKLEGSQRS